jgi:hypothetical protein
MKRQTLACLLGMAMATTGSGLWAQNMSDGAGNAGAANRETSNGSSMTTGSAKGAGQSGNVQGGVTTPQPVNDNGLRISMGDTTAMAGQTQLEGQLVDVYSLARGTASMTGSTNASGSAGAAGLPANTIENNTGTGAINGKGNGMTGSTGTLVPRPEGNTTGNSAGTSMGVAPGGTGSSFGTYDHPGATAGAGTSSLQTGMTGSGISAAGPVEIRNGMTPADAATATGTAGVATGGMGAPAGSGAVGTGNPGNDAMIRQHLSNGVPAAIVANGQTYVLAVDPRQLSAYAGQNVRVSGQVTASRMVVPTNFEVKGASGSYQPVALTRPDQMPAGGNGRTANER